MAKTISSSAATAAGKTEAAVVPADPERGHGGAYRLVDGQRVLEQRTQAAAAQPSEPTTTADPTVTPTAEGA